MIVVNVAEIVEPELFVHRYPLIPDTLVIVPVPPLFPELPMAAAELPPQRKSVTIPVVVVFVTKIIPEKLAKSTVAPLA